MQFLPGTQILPGSSAVERQSLELDVDGASPSPAARIRTRRGTADSVACRATNSGGSTRRVRPKNTQAVGIWKVNRTSVPALFRKQTGPMWSGEHALHLPPDSDRLPPVLRNTRVRRLSDVSRRSVKPSPQGNTAGATPATRTQILPTGEPIKTSSRRPFPTARAQLPFHYRRRDS